MVEKVYFVLYTRGKTEEMANFATRVVIVHQEYVLSPSEL